MTLTYKSDPYTYELLELASLGNNHHTVRITISQKRAWRAPLVTTVDLFCHSTEIHDNTRWYYQDDGSEFDHSRWAVNDLVTRYLRLERFHQVD